jgi:hypothetical protein
MTTTEVTCLVQMSRKLATSYVDKVRNTRKKMLAHPESSIEFAAEVEQITYMVDCVQDALDHTGGNPVIARVRLEALEHEYESISEGLRTLQIDPAGVTREEIGEMVALHTALGAALDEGHYVTLTLDVHLARRFRKLLQWLCDQMEYKDGFVVGEVEPGDLQDAYTMRAAFEFAPIPELANGVTEC